MPADANARCIRPGIPAVPARAFRADTACRPILPASCPRKNVSGGSPPVKSRQRRGDGKMKTDEMRQRIARQPKGHARCRSQPKISGRPGRRLIWLKTISKPSHSSNGAGEIFFAHARAAGNQQQVGIDDCRLTDCPICRFCLLEIFRQMCLLTSHGKCLQQAADQNRIAVADLAGLRRLVRRDNFIAGREMEDAQSRADERICVSRRCQHRQRAGIQISFRLHAAAAPARTSSPRNRMFAALSRRTMRSLVAVALDIFLHHHAQVSARQRRAGRHAHGFAGFELARFPVGGVKRVHDLKSFGRVIFAKSRSRRASSGRTGGKSSGAQTVSRRTRPNASASGARTAGNGWQRERISAIASSSDLIASCRVESPAFGAEFRLPEGGTPTESLAMRAVSKSARPA